MPVIEIERSDRQPPTYHDIIFLGHEGSLSTLSRQNFPITPASRYGSGRQLTVQVLHAPTKAERRPHRHDDFPTGIFN